MGTTVRKRAEASRKRPREPTFRFCILGPLEVWAAERCVPLGGTKRRSALACLLLERNRVVPPGRLESAVWGDQVPLTAQASLHNHLTRLRKALDGRLQRHPGGYLLRVEPNELDLDRFEQLVAEAQRSELPRKAALLRKALALWRGPPFEDLAETPVAASAQHLAELYGGFLEERIAADLALGRDAELLAELEELVDRHPFRERLWEELILALYRSGRQAEALDTYRAVWQRLADELGIEPRPALRALHRAVLRQDRELEPSPPGRGDVGPLLVP